jgi:hypothetical protein
MDEAGVGPAAIREVAAIYPLEKFEVVGSRDYVVNMGQYERDRHSDDDDEQRRAAAASAAFIRWKLQMGEFPKPQTESQQAWVEARLQELDDIAEGRRNWRD